MMFFYNHGTRLHLRDLLSYRDRLEILKFEGSQFSYSNFQNVHNKGTGLCLCLSHVKNTGPKVIKLFSYSTQLSMRFILLINVKMPTAFQNA